MLIERTARRMNIDAPLWSRILCLYARKHVLNIDAPQLLNHYINWCAGPSGKFARKQQKEPRLSSLEF